MLNKDPWYEMKVEVRKQLLVQNPEDVQMDLKNPKNVNPSISRTPTQEIPTILLKSLSRSMRTGMKERQWPGKF